MGFPGLQERLQGGFVDRDGPWFARLRIPVLLGLDMNEAVIEVDVVPLEMGHLPLAHPGEDEELQHGANSKLDGPAKTHAALTSGDNSGTGPNARLLMTERTRCTNLP